MKANRPPAPSPTRLNSLRRFLLYSVCVLCPAVIAGATPEPSDLFTTLDSVFKDMSADGYSVRTWRYKIGTNDFVFYVKDGRKWRQEYVKSRGLPLHGLRAAMTAEVIFSNYGVTPSPKRYIFRDERKQLYRLKTETLIQCLRDDLRKFLERQRLRSAP
jgi:hypothetical protein